MLRVLIAISIAFLVIVAFVGTATPGAAATPGKISGTVINVTSGAAVPGAKVELSGAGTTLTATSDANGKFAFDEVQPGTWALRTTALQYVAQDSGAIPLAAGQAIDLTVALQPVTSTDITSLGRVVVRGQRQLNTSSAASITVSQSQYIDTGALQVQSLLESQPGITIEHFDNGAPGNVATFTIRGAGGFVGGSNTGYELLVLQDGEPIRNGQYGDADVSALTPAIYQRVEVVKGVGGTSLFGANTIGGTLNLVTIDPKKYEGGEVSLTEGGFGTSDYNLSETNTFGRFGYVIDIHRYGTDGFIPPQLAVDVPPFTFSSSATVPPTGAIVHPTLQFNLKSGLGKLRYDFSNNTYAVFTATDESDWRDQFGLLSNPETVFLLATGQSYSADPGGIPYFFGFPDNYVWNTNPKYSLDLHTTLAGGSLVLRAYNNWINRWVDGNQGPTCCFLQKSIDHLTGDLAIWEKPFGKHDLTLAIGGNGDTFQYGSKGSGSPVLADSIPVTVGTQIERTALARDDWDISSRFKGTAALYYSNYNDLNVKRFDPRLAIVNRPDENTTIRLSLGTGFAAPRLSDIVTPLNLNPFQSSTGPDPCPSNPDTPFCYASAGNPKIQAETATGFDIGYERVWGRHGDASIDFYRTDLKNHILTVILPPTPGLTFTDGAPVVGIYTPVNIAGSVYTGMEFAAGIPITNDFTFRGYYNTQAAYPTGLDLATQALFGNVINNQQFMDVPVHKYGWALNFENRSRVNAFFGGDYFAQNNSYNVPPFWLYNAGFNAPLGDNTLHITWRNIFNKNATIFSNFNGGVPYPSIPGFGSGCSTAPCTYATTAFSTQPHILSVAIDHRWGSLK